MNELLRYLKNALIVLGILSIVIYLAMYKLCEIGIKCKNCLETSMSRENSIRDGFYIGEYKALKDSIKLNYHNETIKFKNVWIESQWFHNSDNCLNKKKEKKEGYNVVFEFKKSNENSFLFTLTPITNGQIAETGGGIGEDRKQIRLQYLPDTIWLKIHEKNPVDSIGWTKELEGDVIGFIKK